MPGCAFPEGTLALLAGPCSRHSACPGGGGDHRDRAVEAAPTPPSCPSNPCQAVSRTTGYQAKVGTHRGLMGAPADGKIVAWTITLGSPGQAPDQVLQRQLRRRLAGGDLDPQARHAAVPPGPRPEPAAQPAALLRHDRAVPAQRPRSTSRRARSSASACPRWAPALALGMGNDTSWRASRAKGNCAEPGTQSAQLDIRGPGPVPLPLPHRAPDLQRDADHDAEAAEGAEGRTERGQAGALEQRRDHLRVELACRTCRAARRPRRAGDIASR